MQMNTETEINNSNSSQLPTFAKESHYRFEISNYEINGKVVSLLNTRKGIEIDMEFLQKDNTGLKVWPAAEEFTKYLTEEKRVKELIEGKVVCELGSGTGLCGIFCSFFAKEVIITDWDSFILDVLQYNSSNLNSRNNISVCKLEWGNKENMENIKLQVRSKTKSEIEVVIGCEILYHETHVQKVFETAACLLAEKGGLFILEFTVRFKSLATFISIISQKLGFIFIPITDFHMKNNNISANFSFKTLSMWKIPKKI